MAATRNYTYIIELNTAMWPRKLADELMNTPGLSAHLVSVTDVQTDGHSYGATYTVAGRYARPRSLRRAR